LARWLATLEIILLTAKGALGQSGKLHELSPIQSDAHVGHP
jgi:hypothetical protein